MCIIMCKPVNVAFPEENYLKNCWDNNPDMGGFMYAKGGKVVIRKGFETWDDFKRALNTSRAITGDDVAYVCHFRISTQGYDVSCCQPFPLSSKMKNMRKKRTEASIGVAHNGILDITSDGAKDYSDTMKFITDFLSNIIRGFDWHDDERTVKLIENLIVGSRMAILDKDGNCDLLGNGWVSEGNVYYSNSTYSYKKYAWSGGRRTVWNNYDDDDYWVNYWNGHEPKVTEVKDDKKEDKKENSAKGSKKSCWGDYYNFDTDMYDFSPCCCPYSMEDNDWFCTDCSSWASCPYVKSCLES